MDPELDQKWDLVLYRDLQSDRKWDLGQHRGPQQPNQEKVQQSSLNFLETLKVEPSIGTILDNRLNAAINALSSDSEHEQLQAHQSANSFIDSPSTERRQIDFTDVMHYFMDQFPGPVKTICETILS